LNNKKSVKEAIHMIKNNANRIGKVLHPITEGRVRMTAMNFV
jgi:hypothetical protein